MLQEGRPTMELHLDLLSGKNGNKISNVKNTHNIAELKKGKTYYFVVTAVNGANESSVSEEVSITIGQ